MEIRQNVRGYNVSLAGLLSGGAELVSPVARDGTGSLPPVGTVFSSRDSLFSSGTLGRYCAMVNAVPEAGEKP